MPDKRQILAEGKYIRLVKEGRWEFAERVLAVGAVVIVAVTNDMKILLTEQHRIALGRRVIELPAGLVGDLPDQPDEDWAEAARRELLEETGYDARNVRFLASGPVSAGFGTETVALYRATGLKKMNDGGGVDGEDIRVHEVPLPRVEAWLKRQVKAGLLVDPKVYAGLYFTRS